MASRSTTVQVRLMNRIATICFVTAIALPDAVGDDRSGPSSEARVTARQLIDSVPVVSSDDESLGSFEVAGQMPTLVGPPVRLRFAWQRGNRPAMLLTTTEDETPVVWSAAGQALFHDPTRGPVLLQGAIPSISIEATDRHVVWNLGFQDGGEIQKVDLRSFFLTVPGDWTIEKRETDWRMSQRSQSGKSVLIATFSAEPKPRFQRFEIRSADDTLALMFSIDEFRVDQPIDHRFLRFPDDVARKTNAQNVRIESKLTLERLIEIHHRAIFVSAAINEPSARVHPAFDQLLGMNEIDWDGATKRHRDMAPLLKAAVAEHLSD
jgi:hypothetical protein